MWYEWDTKFDFDVWHNALCEQLGYPIIGLNQATGLPDENAQKTIAYTNAIEVENKWIAWVDAEYSGNLTLSNLRPIVIEPALGL